MGDCVGNKDGAAVTEQTPTPRRKPNRKRRNFVGIWLDDAERKKLDALAEMAGEPDSPSAGLRYALRYAPPTGHPR